MLLKLLNLSPLKFSNELLCLLDTLLVVVRVRALVVALDGLDLEVEVLADSLGSFGLEADVVVLDEVRVFALLYDGVAAVDVVLLSPRIMKGCLDAAFTLDDVVALLRDVVPLLNREPGLGFCVDGACVSGSGSGRLVDVPFSPGRLKFVYRRFAVLT